MKKALDRGVSFLRSDYVAILEHMDHNIGCLVDLLDELGVAENTLIVFFVTTEATPWSSAQPAAGSRQQWTVSGRQGDNVSGRAERAVADELERPTAPRHGLG